MQPKKINNLETASRIYWEVSQAREVGKPKMSVSKAFKSLNGVLEEIPSVHKVWRLSAKLTNDIVQNNREAK